MTDNRTLQAIQSWSYSCTNAL